MINFSTYLSEAGAGAERQENGFVKAINDAFKLAKKGITVKTNDMTVLTFYK